MSGSFNRLLPEDDFWRTVSLGAILVFLVPLVAITGALAPEALVAGVVLAFVAWAMTRRDASDERADESEELDAVETLRKRYASGQIDDAEFERRLDALIETESVGSGEKEPSLE
ncbi:SHOCT domain-containing protein [Haladaptatus salinisoli]|uniref:SHOCT domain-containing protein n=1 Tax=Haladaptatus salinisoli TaxID=2884876 RepID=UPI001D0A25E0|nr:SHOCT domain-containing protein [Haladaptatus salinisoli]